MGSLRGRILRLAAQDVDDEENHDHQNGEPNRQFAKRIGAGGTPVEGEAFGAGERSTAVAASARLE